MTRCFYNTKKSGQAMLIAVVFFLIISLVIVVGMATPILYQVRSSRDLLRSKASLYLATAGLEDALFRLKANKVVNTGDTITLNESQAALTVVNAFNARTVTSRASVSGTVRAVEVSVITGAGVSFNYGVQTGNGGFILANSSGVDGNVYSNGDIIGSNGSFITGTAVAANSASMVTDQSNGSSGTPPSSITFRNSNLTQDVAERFQVSATAPINKARFYIKKTGNPGNATVRVVRDNGGAPGSIVVDTATLGDGSGAAAITTNFGWVTATFTSNAELQANTSYWLIIENGGTYNASNNYTIAANTNYSAGLAKIGKYSTQVWNDTTPAGLDIYFEIYMGGLMATIQNVEVGTGSTGDARAHTVTNSTVHGNLYCQSGSGNNKPCNTSGVDPVSVGYPISDANIEQWKADAAAGGTISGTLTVSEPMSLGPKKIQGNLVINDTLTLTGTVWVTGTVSGANGSEVKLDPSYEANSGVIAADGFVDLSNNMQFRGVSGQNGTYILLLTTNACPFSSPCAPSNSAIYLGNNAGAVILNAQNGKLHLKNGASINEAVAYQIELDPNAVVNYVSGLANMNFTSGPSGGWNITRWQEVE